MQMANRSPLLRDRNAKLNLHYDKSCNNERGKHSRAYLIGEEGTGMSL